MTTDDPIPLLDLRPEVEQQWDELMDAITSVVRSTRFILGDEVNGFESEMADRFGVAHAIGVNSGTDALILGLQALGVEPGDEVVTTGFSFVATAGAIVQCGATPVFVDIDPATFNIDPDALASAITGRTKAIIPVHLYGQSADMDPIVALANEHGVAVLEDAAQAFGARYRGRPVGQLGDACALSFFPSKNLGAFGDGGMILTDSDDAAAAARMLRAHGSRRKYHAERLGFNSRLDALQAAVLRVRARYVDENNEGRRRVAARYDELLGDVDGVTTPVVAPDCEHVFHQYVVRIDSSAVQGGRDAVKSSLADAGIASMTYYPVPLHQMPPFAGDVSLPHAELACGQVLALPIWPTMPSEAQERVASSIRSL